MWSNSSPSSLDQPISEKLTRENFLLWKAHVIPTVRGAQLFGYLDGTVVEPEKTDVATHAAWVVQDQPVLGFINASREREWSSAMWPLTPHLQWCGKNSLPCSRPSLGLTPSSFERIWQQCARGGRTVAIYYNKMKCFADEMATVGKSLEDDDFVSYVLGGLDHDYNSFVENVMGKTEISLGS
jgi:hypothetical protein